MWSQCVPSCDDLLNDIMTYRHAFYTQTEAQEVGWYSQVLCPDMARDPRFYHPTRQSEVTKFMNEYFKLLDAQKMAANS